MKTKYSLLIAFISVLLALSVISCNNDSVYDDTNSNVTEYVELHIGQIGLDSNARQIDKVDFAESYKSAKYVLSGTLKDSDGKFEETYDGLSALENASIKVQPGEWTFTLVAYDPEDKDLEGSILSDTKVIEVSSSTEVLNFNLSFCETQTVTGNLDYTIKVPYVTSASMTIVLVKDGSEDFELEVSAMDPVSQKTYNGLSTPEGYVLNAIPLVQKDDFYETTFSFTDLGIGTYQLFIVYTTDFLNDDLSEETMANEQNIQVYPLITRTGSKEIAKINKKYKIYYEDSVFEDDGITGNENLPNIGTSYNVSRIPALARNHWSFDGWHYKVDAKNVSLTTSAGESGETIYILPSGLLVDEITLYPDWTEIPLGKFAVTFNTMGGSTIASQTVEEDSCATLPENPTKDGYEFDGWYTDSSFKTMYDFETPVTETITLYAKWKVVEYTITYKDIEDATNPNAETTTYTIESETINLADASKTGYTFAGWYVSTTAETPVKEIAAGSTGNVELYARWTINSYEVTFVTDWDDWKPAAETVNYNGKVSEPTPTTTREDYDLTGWYTDSAFKNKFDFETPITESITLYAKWTIKTFTIRYTSDYGTVPVDKTVNWGTKLTETDLASISATGWEFKGWKINDTDTLATTETTVTDELTLTAVWEIVKVTISYETAHGTAPESVTVDYGAILATAYLEGIETDGYEFEKWLIDGEAAEAGTTLTADITLSAKWKVVEYTITYKDIEDATNPNAETTTYTIESETINLADASKTGYTFAGWYVSTTAETPVKEIAAGSTGNVELYARWTINSYEVTFVTDWDDWKPAAETVNYNGKVSEPTPTTTREDYDLTGWYTDSAFKNKFDFETPITESITLYAKWTIKTFTIRYTSDYGTVPVDKTVNWGTKLTETDLASISATGWEFKGWKINDTDTLATTETTVTDELTLTAVWEIVKVTISYETAHGTAPESVTVDYGAILATAYLEGIETDGYEFEKWLIDGEAAEAGTTLTADITLSAKWKLVAYTISYSGVDNATNPNAETISYTIESETINLTDASKAGYTFEGWYIGSDTENPVKEIAVGSTGDVELTARWSDPIEYSITYDLNDSEEYPAQNASANPENYTIESGTDGKLTLAAPERPGYTFKGWTTENAEGETVSITEIDVTKLEPVSVTATWEQTFTITITFESIPEVTASGTWELTKETRTATNIISGQDEQYDVFKAPEGWTTYTWYVDGAEIEIANPEIPYEYEPNGSGGTHSLNCLMTRTVEDGNGGTKTETIYLTGHFTITYEYVPMG